jgi:hypothetical protein
MVNFFIKRHKFEKTPLYASSLGNGLNEFQLKLFNLWQLIEPKTILPKLAPMNNCYWNNFFSSNHIPFSIYFLKHQLIICITMDCLLCNCPCVHVKLH